MDWHGVMGKFYGRVESSLGIDWIRKRILISMLYHKLLVLVDLSQGNLRRKSSGHINIHEPVLNFQLESFGIYGNILSTITS
jgi:hypothetical protein